MSCRARPHDLTFLGRSNFFFFFRWRRTQSPTPPVRLYTTGRSNYPHGESNPGFRTENPIARPGIAENKGGFSGGAAPGAAVGAEIVPDSPPIHPDLARLTAAWPALPVAVKAAISAIVKAMTNWQVLRCFRSRR